MTAPMDDESLPEQVPMELSIPVSMAEVGDKAKRLKFVADKDQRKAIAKRLDLLSLDRFEGQLQIRPWRRAGLVLQGHIIADLSQACVVSLEPVADHLDVSFTTHFLPQDMIDELEKKMMEEGEIFIDAENDDPIDPIIQGSVNVGESSVQQLALAVNPYPRKPDVDFTPPESAAAPKENPFAVLEKLKKPD
ncbi:MAG: hypothetical protein GC184_11795 [Rhizobiales bacterium]|nr:hypothetical protein [Hyphomicrobiales bacterium]